MIDEGYADLREAAKSHRERLQRRLEQSQVKGEVVLTETQSHSAKQILAVLARYADVVMIAAPGSFHADSARLHSTFGTLAASAGRPVIAVSREARLQFPARRIVVGWSPTPEASRAVHDALPLLQHAQHVDIVLVEPETGELSNGSEPGAAIAAHLARHGVPVNVQPRPRSFGAVGTQLLLAAEEGGADLIVAGAYGHSRAREWAFGGTTRELLERSRVPVLFSQ